MYQTIYVHFKTRCAGKLNQSMNGIVRLSCFDRMVCNLLRKIFYIAFDSFLSKTAVRISKSLNSWLAASVAKYWIFILLLFCSTLLRWVYTQMKLRTQKICFLILSSTPPILLKCELDNDLCGMPRHRQVSSLSFWGLYIACRHHVVSSKYGCRSKVYLGPVLGSSCSEKREMAMKRLFNLILI